MEKDEGGEGKKENSAKVLGRDLPISTKQAIEICNFIRRKKLQDAKRILEEVIDKKRAIPMRRFTGGAGHKRKIGPGKYPKKASLEILKLLDSLEANAQFKGLNTSDLVITELRPNKAAKSWHYGRWRRRAMKRTNLDIICREKKE